MQTLKWYMKRLRGMSAGEVAWRVASAVRDRSDRVRFAAGWVPGVDRVLPAGDGAPPARRLTDFPVGAWREGTATREEGEWARRLRGRADSLLAHRFSFFDMEDRFLGNPVDWNRDHSALVPSPTGFSASIDYRDFRVAGDAKVVWEPNRHHHLVVLARAWRAFGEKAYAEEVVRQVESWLDQCPFGTGMNWRSPLELAIRLINWTWCHDLLQESGAFSGDFRRRFLHAAYLHLWEVRRKYSRGSSSNNHSIGEAAGVYIGAACLPGLRVPARWREEAREILEAEIRAQTFPDGCNREHAFGYHLFVLQFFLLAALAARRSGQSFSPGYMERLEGMFDFAAAMAEGGAPPFFGDCDDGYVLDLGGGKGDLYGLLPVGAALFGDRYLHGASLAPSEPARWLPGTGEAWRGREGEERAIGSRSFAHAGYYLLQAGSGEGRVSAFFDCAELGFGAIAAHGHADALSFTLRIGGREVFVDPGTYDYFTYPEWRSHFRGTGAHNTAMVDGADQSVMEGLFLWGHRAGATALLFEPREGGGGTVSGEHDGYERLSDPVRHRRTLSLAPEARRLDVTDEFLAKGNHEAALHFHLAEGCHAEVHPGNRVRISQGDRAFTLHVDPALAVRIAVGGDRSNKLGWVSRRYHEKVPSGTVACTARFGGTARFRCSLEY